MSKTANPNHLVEQAAEAWGKPDEPEPEADAFNPLQELQRCQGNLQELAIEVRERLAWCHSSAVSELHELRRLQQKLLDRKNPNERLYRHQVEQLLKLTYALKDGISTAQTKISNAGL